MHILAFGHQKRVGKDTASQYATTILKLDGKYKRIEKRGFADKLKDICYQLYGWAGMQPGPFYEEHQNHHLKDTILPALGKSPRQIWISFGNTVKEAAYRDTWLDYLLKSVCCDFLIITDMRFPNEAERIKSMGGQVYKIIRPSVIHTSDAADDPLLSYSGWTGTIIKGGSLADLYNSVRHVLKELRSTNITQEVKIDVR